VVEHRKGKSIEEAIEIIKEARARVANKNKVVDAEVIEE